MGNESLSLLIVCAPGAPTEHETTLFCTDDSVFDLLASLDTSKSSGPGNISALMLKRTAASIAPSITQLFNQSLQLGKIPSDWNVSHVVPISTASPCSKVTKQLQTYLQWHFQVY